MIAVTDKFKTYAANPRREVEFKCLIGETEYTRNQIVDLDIEDSVVSNEDFEIGAVVSSKLGLTLRTEDTIANNASAKPFVRFTVDGDPSEWLQQGEMFIDSRLKIGSVYKFSCYDKLITASKTYTTDLLFPNTQYQMLIELAYNLGIEIEDETLAMINTAYSVSGKPEDNLYTFRDIIKFIAISHGCSARMSNVGKLEFVSFVDRTVVKTIPASDNWNPRELNPFKEIKKLVFNYSTNLEPIIIGEGDEAVTLYLNNPFVTVDMANEIFTDLYDLNYSPFSFNWKCEPWIQAGDFISVATRQSSFNTIVLRMRKKYKGGLSASIEAPSSSGTQSEFGYQGTLNQSLSEVNKRIGLFAHATNTSKKTIKQTVVQVALMPLTTASETDIEFVVTLNGTASVASMVRITFRISGSDIGREMRVPVVAGQNFISFSTLSKKLPKVSDWLFCRMKVDSGNFVIEKDECEFYIYGGNIVSGEVKPILDFTDGAWTNVSLIAEDLLLVELQTPIPVTALESATTAVTITATETATILIP